MGNQNGRKALEEYWETRDKAQPEKKKLEKARKIFDFYDSNHSGVLEREQAKAYINDLLEVSNVKNNILREAAEKQRSGEEYYMEFLNEVFVTLDRNGNGKIEFEEFMKPDNEVMSFVSQVSQKLARNPSRSHLIKAGNLTPAVTPGAPAPPVVPGPTNPPEPKPAASGKKLVAEIIPGPVNPPSSPSTPTGSQTKIKVQPMAPQPPPMLKAADAKPAAVVQKECNGGCGFFGHEGNEGYCSQCYKKLKAPPASVASAVPAAVVITPSASGSPKTETKKAEKAPPTPAAIEPEEEPVDENEDEDDEDEENHFGAGGMKDSGNWMLDDAPEYEEKRFQIITKSDITAMQDKIINDLSGKLGITKGEVALVLMQFDWDADKLESRYFDKPQEYLKQAGVVATPAAPADVSAATPVDCLVCFDSVPFKDTFELPCGHRYYCQGCWKSYLSEKAEAAAATLGTKCIQKGCEARLTRENWDNLAKPEDLKRYKYFFMKSFVDTNPKLGFCPNPSCDRAVRYTGFGRPMDVVECTCGARYCFSCGLENHNPVTCEMVTRWRDRNQDDQESIKLIAATSKQCPHCGMPTERNEGCNHMTCRKEVGGCAKEWCWMCRGDWKTHGSHTGGFYSCNKYDKSDGKKKDDEAVTLKASAERFAHYWERFAGHEQNKKDAEKAREKILQKTVQYREATGCDPKFLTEALELLIQCRHMLKWTYVYSYFLDDSKDKGGGVRKEFFEYQQANAEGVTERLASLLFAEISKMKADELKNMIRVTRKYIENLSKSLSEGSDDIISHKPGASLKSSVGAKPVKPAAAIKQLTPVTSARSKK